MSSLMRTDEQYGTIRDMLSECHEYWRQRAAANHSILYISAEVSPWQAPNDQVCAWAAHTGSQHILGMRCSTHDGVFLCQIHPLLQFPSDAHTSAKVACHLPGLCCSLHRSSFGACPAQDLSKGCFRKSEQSASLVATSC